MNKIEGGIPSSPKKRIDSVPLIGSYINRIQSERESKKLLHQAYSKARINAVNGFTTLYEDPDSLESVQKTKLFTKTDDGIVFSNQWTVERDDGKTTAFEVSLDQTEIDRMLIFRYHLRSNTVKASYHDFQGRQPKDLAEFIQMYLGSSVDKDLTQKYRLETINDLRDQRHFSFGPSYNLSAPSTPLALSSRLVFTR